jgi:AcrR family transcriptional regulator
MEKTETAPRSRMSKEERRALILGEAMRIVGEQGYRAFSLSALAKRCGLTNAGLLHYFGSKEGLLIALLQERDRLDEAAVMATMGRDASKTPTREACLQGLHAVVAHNSRQPELVRLYAMLNAEALMADHPAHAFFKKRESAAIEIFSQMIAHLVPDPASTARALVGLMNGLEVQWLRDELGFDLVAAWDKAAAKLLT